MKTKTDFINSNNISCINFPKGGINIKYKVNSPSNRAIVSKCKRNILLELCWWIVWKLLLWHMWINCSFFDEFMNIKRTAWESITTWVREGVSTCQQRPIKHCHCLTNCRVTSEEVNLFQFCNKCWQGKVYVNLQFKGFR